MPGKTLYDKLWESHVVREEDDGTSLIYIDRHLLHEVTSPQAFSGLKEAGRKPRRVGANLAVADHNVPTTDREGGIDDPISHLQVETLDLNCREFGITEYDMNDPRQGIVHVIGPEQGVTQPGMTIVCGDSHTATHGAFGALSFGIGTSEVEHVLATQCLISRRMRNMRVTIEGELQTGVTSKDMILAVIGHIGTSGGTGCAIEFDGSSVRRLSMEGRMTLCNMAIEAGARAGLVAVDDTTIDYLKGRTYAPKGNNSKLLKKSGGNMFQTLMRFLKRRLLSMARLYGRRSPGGPLPRWCRTLMASSPIPKLKWMKLAGKAGSERWSIWI